MKTAPFCHYSDALPVHPDTLTGQYCQEAINQGGSSTRFIARNSLFSMSVTTQSHEGASHVPEVDKGGI